MNDRYTFFGTLGRLYWETTIDALLPFSTEMNQTPVDDLKRSTKNIDLSQSLSILANVGVIAGIAFLAIEMRQNNELLEAQARFNYFQTRIELSAAAVSNPNISELTAKGYLGEDMTPAEKFQFYLWGVTTLTAWQYEVSEYQKGNLTLEELDIPIKRITYFSRAFAMQEAAESLPLRDEFSQFLQEHIIEPCAHQQNSCTTSRSP